MELPLRRKGIGVTPKWSCLYAEMESVLRRNYDLFSVLLRNLNDDCQTKYHTKH